MINKGNKRFVVTLKRATMMKTYYQAAQKASKSQHTTIDGPLHRFYQHQSTEKHFSVAARRQGILIRQPVEKRKGRVQSLVQKHQSDVYHRQQTQISHLLQQDEQGAPYLTAGTSSDRIRSSVRVVWLQQTAHSLPKAVGLRTRFGDAGMQVHLQQRNDDVETKLDGELILLECLGMYEQEMMIAVVTVRHLTQAPLIVLTDNHTLDWSIRALHSGADAIFTVNMPDEVIVARSKALVKRWVSI
jgi:hypothetical protein